MKGLIHINAFVLLVTTTWPMCWTLDNGLALTPPMGFRVPLISGYYDENYIKTLADKMVSEGYKRLGYEYILFPSSAIFSSARVTDKEFPSKMRELAHYVHSKGLKLGIQLLEIASSRHFHYSVGNASWQDDVEKLAQTVAQWDIDYVQLYDPRPITAEIENLTNATVSDYIKFGKYLNKTGRPILYECAWLYRLQTHSIEIDDEIISNHCNIFPTLDFGRWQLPRNNLSLRAGPGHWADKGYTYYNFSNSTKRLMTEYAIFAFPIMPDFAIKHLTSASTKAILQNEKVVEVNQDPLGIPGRTILKECGIEVVTRPVTPVVEGKKSIALGIFCHGWGNSTAEYSVALDKLGLYNANGYKFTDLFSSSTDNSSFILLRGSELNVTFSGGATLLKATPLPKLEDHFIRR